MQVRPYMGLMYEERQGRLLHPVCRSENSIEVWSGLHYYQ